MKFNLDIELPVIYANLHWTEVRIIREAYISKQKNKCWYCKQSLKKKPTKIMKRYPIDRELFPPGFFNYPVHLHHSHNSGLTIGAVHSYCNAVLRHYHGE